MYRSNSIGSSRESRQDKRGKRLKEIFLSVLTGFGCGVVFAAFKLPVPAPPVFAGVAGIIGLWAGYAILIKVLS
jgi:XapX domain-containing protein